MSGAVKADAERLMLMLSELRLPATRAMWSTFTERADTEGWPAARFLSTLIEHEIAEREQRRLARFLNEAHLLPGKSLGSTRSPCRDRRDERRQLSAT